MHAFDSSLITQFSHVSNTPTRKCVRTNTRLLWISLADYRVYQTRTPEVRSADGVPYWRANRRVPMWLLFNVVESHLNVEQDACHRVRGIMMQQGVFGFKNRCTDKASINARVDKLCRGPQNIQSTSKLRFGDTCFLLFNRVRVYEVWAL